MKKLLTVLIMGMLSMNMASATSKPETYNVKNLQGVRTSYYKVYKAGNTVVKIDTYNTQGVRQSTIKKVR